MNPSSNHDEGRTKPSRQPSRAAHFSPQLAQIAPMPELPQSPAPAPAPAPAPVPMQTPAPTASADDDAADATETDAKVEVAAYDKRVSTDLVYDMGGYSDELESEEHTGPTGHGIRRRTHSEKDLARRKMKHGSFVGLSGSGRSVINMLMNPGRGGRSLRGRGGDRGSDGGDGTLPLDLSLKALIWMAEDECLEAALGDIELSQPPGVLRVVFSVTGIGPCPHSRPWLHYAVKYSFRFSLYLRCLTHLVLAIVGAKMDGVSQTN